MSRWKGADYMNVKITYPAVEKHRLQRNKFLKILRWPYLAAAVICPVVNYCTGGKAWSVIVLMGMYMMWKLVLSPDLVEYNRLSQTIKLIVYSCILMVLIDYFLAPGWASTVVPIVGFGGLALAGTLLFSDLERQKQNYLPLLFLIILALVATVVGLNLWEGASQWALMVLGGVAVLLLISSGISMGSDFIRELKRRFHIK